MQTLFKYSGSSSYAFLTDGVDLRGEIKGSHDVQPDWTIDQTIDGVRMTADINQVHVETSGSRGFFQIVEDIVSGSDVKFQPTTDHSASWFVKVDIQDRQTMASVRKGVIQQGQRVRLLSTTLQSTTVYDNIQDYYD